MQGRAGASATASPRLDTRARVGWIKGDAAERRLWRLVTDGLLGDRWAPRVQPVEGREGDVIDRRAKVCQPDCGRARQVDDQVGWLQVAVSQVESVAAGQRGRRVSHQPPEEQPTGRLAPQP